MSGLSSERIGAGPLLLLIKSRLRWSTDNWSSGLQLAAKPRGRESTA